MITRILSRFILGLVFLCQTTAHAQVMYIVNDAGQLWKYDAKGSLVTPQAAQKINPVLYNGGGVSLADIASGYLGSLWGVDFGGNVFKIDPETAVATKIGNTGNTNGIGLTFTPPDSSNPSANPEGVLWGASGGTLYTIDLQDGHGTPVMNLPGGPSGDVLYNPMNQKLYLDAYNPSGGSDLIMEIDPFPTPTPVGFPAPAPVAGTLVNRGAFQWSGVYGADFTGHGEEVFGMAGNQVLNMQKASSAATANWTLQNHFGVDTTFSNCYGATKFHCVSKPAIQWKTQPGAQGFQCGAPMIVDASLSQNVVQYQWTVSGTDLSGTSHSIALPVVVLAAGQTQPPDFNINDEQWQNLLAPLQMKISNERRARGPFTVSLTTWCDPYEKPVTVSLAPFWVQPLVLSWMIDPAPMNGAPPNGDPLNYTYQYFYDTTTTFQKTDIQNAVSRQWILDENTPQMINLTGAPPSDSATHFWDKNTTGTTHRITHQVTNENGCFSSESAFIQILDYKVFLPTGFTPNGDGKNDTFGPIFPDHPPQYWKLNVYNRFGQLVFDGGSHMQTRWDGNVFGTPGEMGTYMYQLFFEAEGATKEEMIKGDVTLVR